MKEHAPSRTVELARWVGRVAVTLIQVLAAVATVYDVGGKLSA
jgi:hypothetical protein